MVLQRVVQVAFGDARNAPVAEDVGIVRPEPDGLGEILQRAVQVSFGAARIAPVEVVPPASGCSEHSSRATTLRGRVQLPA
jgi:hypothetical protein